MNTNPNISVLDTALNPCRIVVFAQNLESGGVSTLKPFRYAILASRLAFVTYTTSTFAYRGSSGCHLHLRLRVLHVKHPVRDRFGRVAAGLSAPSAESETSISLPFAVEAGSFALGSVGRFNGILSSVKITTGATSVPLRRGVKNNDQ